MLQLPNDMRGCSKNSLSQHVSQTLEHPTWFFMFFGSICLTKDGYNEGCNTFFPTFLFGSTLALKPWKTSTPEPTLKSPTGTRARRRSRFHPLTSLTRDQCRLPAGRGREKRGEKSATCMGVGSKRWQTWGSPRWFFVIFLLARHFG